MVMPLRDDLYWFQCEAIENGQEIYILFLVNDRLLSQLSELYLPDMTEDQFRQFAGQYRVTVDERDDATKLSGSRDDILAFLKAHADVPLKPLRVTQHL
jgi:hypothetical protein